MLKSCFPALQSEVFEHNSFDFGNLMMGLVVLESWFYGLSTWFYKFLHLKCRNCVNRVVMQLFFLGLLGGNVIL